jgi:hypothetical protein
VTLVTGHGMRIGDPVESPVSEESDRSYLRRAGQVLERSPAS